MDTETGFSNQPIDHETLPDYRACTLEPVASAYLPWALVTNSVFWIILLLASVLAPRLPFVALDPHWWQPMVVAGLLVVALVHVVLDARFRGWALREHDLIYRHGVVWHKTVIVPFARIQHVEAVNGPMERWFGLMRLKCYTAGGAGADLTVKGLARGDAMRVRQFLLEQIRSDSGPETDAEAS